VESLDGTLCESPRAGYAAGLSIWSRFALVVRIACASGRHAEYLAGQSKYSRVVKSAGRLRFADGCESERKSPFRTLTPMRDHNRGRCGQRTEIEEQLGACIAPARF
jgi:hypothetical protein